MLASAQEVLHKMLDTIINLSTFTALSAAHILSKFTLGKVEGSVDFSELAPFITAIGGLVLGVLGANHNKKNTTMQDNQSTISSIIQGFTSQIEAYSKIVSTLQSEVTRINEEIETERAAWQEKMESALREWEKARLIYEEKIKLLEGELVEDDAEETIQ